MPGSTFKVITTGIGIEAGVIDRTTQFVRESEWVPPQTTNPIQNYRGSTCGGDLPEVFRRSCNIPFAQTAISLGPDRMVAGVDAWGIGEELPIDLPGAAASTFGDTADLAQQLPLLGIRGFGQNDDQMVPLHMSMVAGTVANGGQMMTPYVVEATYDHDGRTLDRTQPEVWKTPISAPTAALLTEFMTGVTEGDRGTARSVQLADGQRFAAKTGTAELGLVGDPRPSARLDDRICSARSAEVLDRSGTDRPHIYASRRRNWRSRSRPRREDSPRLLTHRRRGQR